MGGGAHRLLMTPNSHIHNVGNPPPEREGLTRYLKKNGKWVLLGYLKRSLSGGRNEEAIKLKKKADSKIRKYGTMRRCPVTKQKTGGTPWWAFSIFAVSLSARYDASNYPLTGTNRPPESHTVGSFCSCIPQYIGSELYSRMGSKYFQP